MVTIFLQEDGIFLGSLDDVPGGPGSGFLGSIKNILDLDFGEQEEGERNVKNDCSLVHPFPYTLQQQGHGCPLRPKFSFTSWSIQVLLSFQLFKNIW